MGDTKNKDSSPILSEEEKKRQREAIEKVHSKKKYKKVTWRSILRLFGISI